MSEDKIIYTKGYNDRFIYLRSTIINYNQHEINYVKNNPLRYQSEIYSERERPSFGEDNVNHRSGNRKEEIFMENVSNDHDGLFPSANLILEKAKKRFLEYREKGYPGMDYELLELMETIPEDKMIPLFSCAGHLTCDERIENEVFIKEGTFYILFVVKDKDWIS